MDQAQSQSIHLEEDNVIHINEDQSKVGGSGSTSGCIPIPNKRAKRETSAVWNYFTKIGKKANGVERAICNGCKSEFKVGPGPKPGGANYGTSHLHRHIESCKKLLIPNPQQMLIDYEGKMMARKFDPKATREWCAKAIIKHDLPYSFVEYDMIRGWAKSLNPDAILPSRNTVVSDVHKIYLREKEKLQQLMLKIPNRICLTSDVWTACTSEGYICLTAHFVNDEWELCSKILNFCRMPPPHTGVELAATILDCLKKWGVEKKIFSLTLDNASANDNMQDVLKSHFRLQNSLLCNGEFFHVRCSAHILNLIVQEGLKVANEALYKIRESVKFVKGSDGRMKKFKECTEQLGINEGVGLRLDVSTRWNSTYLMLESAIKYERAFASLELADRTYKYCPTEDEWRIGKMICEFLEPFYDTTNLISGSSYPTSNLYFKQVWKIECILNKNMNSEDDIIKDMAQRMKMKFDKYWKDYSVVLAFGAILDPRMKLDFLKFCFSKIDASTCEEKVENVKRELYKLFEDYKTSTPTNASSTSSISTTLSSRGKEAKLYNEFLMYQNESLSTSGKNELDMYLEDPKLNFILHGELDVLKFWKDNVIRFPDLSVLARDVLSIPITTVASESTFSIGGHIITKYRNSLQHENVQMLVCTKNWLDYRDGNI